MGMSGDFETAIRFGATHVRVGTAIFGARDVTPGTIRRSSELELSQSRRQILAREPGDTAFGGREARPRQMQKNTALPLPCTTGASL